jgi:predicted permease
MKFLNRIFRPERAKTDLEAEIQAHLTMAAADKRDRGASAEAAQQEAERDFGNQALVKDVTRRMWGWGWLESLQRDAAYALRQLRRSRGFSLTVIATLALGIGAATAMFAVVDRVLLRPLPYLHPERLVTVDEAVLHGKSDLNRGAAYIDLKAWQQQNKTFDQIAYYTTAGRGNFLEGNGGAGEIYLTHVSPNFFSTLGVRPQFGHGFYEDVDPFTDGKNVNTIVLSNVAWQERYGGDPAILGKNILLNGQGYAVVGVMPKGFTFGELRNGPQVWTIAQLSEADKSEKDRPRSYSVIGRLKDGLTPAEAQADLSTLQPQIVKSYQDPDTRESRSSVLVRKYADAVVDVKLERALITLLAASGVLWLIACVNVTNLCLVRATARQREIAVRGALGASRRQIMQQLLIEGLVLSGAASLFGSLLALNAIKVFEMKMPANLSIQLSGSVSATVLLLVLVGLTLLSTVVSSMWPALLAAHTPIEPVLRQSGQQSGTSRRQHRLRNSLVVAEIAMSLVLLSACGLLLRTIYALRHVPLGFHTDHVIVANLVIPSYRFTGRDMTTQLYQPLLERAQHLPGAQSAALMTEVPLGQTFRMILSLVGKGYGSQRNENNPITSNFRAVSPEAQQVFGFGMLTGRYFNQRDTPGSQPVAVVNRAFVKLYAPDPQNPASVLGMHLLNMRKDQPVVVVGVLDDARQSSITEPLPEVEICIPQMTPDSNSYHNVLGMAMDLAIRTSRPLASITPELRALLLQASPEFAGATITTMDQVVVDSYGSQTLAAHLLEFFGGTALLLCVAGLYGALAYVMAQRTREIGVRIALGAQRWQASWLVMRQAAVMVVAGVLIGMALSIASARFMRGFLYGVAEHDITTLIVVALILFVSSALAAYSPAQRASKVNPVEALRAE